MQHFICVNTAMNIIVGWIWLRLSRNALAGNCGR